MSLYAKDLWATIKMTDVRVVVWNNIWVENE